MSNSGSFLNQLLAGGGLLAGLTASVTAQQVDVSQLPPAANVTIDFAQHIQPILTEYCLKCHGEERPKSNYRLTNREDALNGGDYGDNIMVGDSANSALIHFVAHAIEEWEMPPTDEGKQLSDNEVGLLRAWIDQGLEWPEPELEPIHFSVTPGFSFLWIEGNEDKFRQITGIDEGFSAGIASFDYSQQVDERTEFTVTGSIRGDSDNYDYDLELARRDVGFIRMGFENLRSFYNDFGGYYEVFDEPSFSLDRDLELDRGEFYFEVGLDRPNLPLVVLGYEYHYLNGQKSLTEWGVHYEDADGRNIVPTYKDIDQERHVVRLDISQEFEDGLRFEDQARFEWMDNRTTRYSSDSSTVVPNVGDPFVETARVTQTRDDYEHFQGANFFRLEKQIKPWWLLSGGHHFSRIDGEARFNRTSVFSPDTSPFAFTEAESQQIILDRYSNILNGNTSLGPWQGFTFSAGVQAEWMRQDGVGNIYYFESPNAGSVESSIDRNSFQETLLLQYTKIPFTVVYADAQFQQIETDLRESQQGGATIDFDRDTDAYGNHNTFGGGIEMSPWVWGSLNLHYTHSIRDTDFDHDIDVSDEFDPADSGMSYSAFIRGLEQDKDTFKVKLSLRPFSKLRFNLAYELIDTDYTTTTDPALDFGGQPVTPGGSVNSGNYLANVYTVGATYSPFIMLHLTANVSYRDSKTETFSNNDPAVASYDGATLSVLTTATFYASERTAINVGYTFTTSNYSQNTAAFGLPYGTEFDWHQPYVRVSHRFSESLATTVQYAFYYYDEATSGGVNDFTGHGIFAAVNWTWR